MPGPAGPNVPFGYPRAYTEPPGDFKLSGDLPSPSFGAEHVE